jgi:hypothetical protein
MALLVGPSCVVVVPESDCMTSDVEKTSARANHIDMSSAVSKAW